MGATGRKIVVLDEAQLDEGFARGLTEVLTLFYVRLSGRGSARRRADAAVVAMSAAGGSVRS
jgi:putative resolvase